MTKTLELHYTYINYMYILGYHHRVNTELSLDLKIDSAFWESNGDIGIVFY